MEKVLLAIDGITPDKKAFNYAVDLCMRIKAELKVLQVVRPQNFGGYVAKVKNTAKQAKQFIEGSMMAATFAEAGEHETADTLMDEALKNINKLLPESKKAGVPCDLMMKSGNLREEIVKYVRDHRDVVITVYDASGGEPQKSGDRKMKTALKSITKALPIPVVMVQAEA
ncbi:MAG: universal stress protein [Candidatus Margulisbacteria bacterium]|nr:universal stress protein [Candidatus Margulisiibacteriota bacterium]